MSQCTAFSEDEREQHAPGDAPQRDAPQRDARRDHRRHPRGATGVPVLAGPLAVDLAVDDDR